MFSTNAAAGSGPGVSLARLYVLRAMYALNLVFLGSDVWPGILSSDKVWDPTPGVAISFWAALSALSCLGLRYPLAMLPLLFLQLCYKAVWLFAVARPLHFAGSAKEMTTVFIAGLVLDVIVIPWPYVWSHYVKARGDRWR
jgi:hypothetical protein